MDNVDRTLLQSKMLLLVENIFYNIIDILAIK